MQENTSEDTKDMEGRLMLSEDDERELRERRVVDAEIKAAERVVDEVRHSRTAKQLAQNPYFMDTMSRMERSGEASEVAELLGNFENIFPKMAVFLETFTQELLEEGTDFEKLHKDHVAILRHILLLYRSMKRIQESGTTTKTHKGSE